MSAMSSDRSNVRDVIGSLELSVRDGLGSIEPSVRDALGSIEPSVRDGLGPLCPVLPLCTVRITTPGTKHLAFLMNSANSSFLMSRQTELPFRTWGGKRAGAGRPPNGRKAGVSHLRRPAHSERHPVHVTLRVLPQVPNLRRKRNFRTIVRAIASARERLGGRIIHFSVQTNHVHLILEAQTRGALSRSAQGLSVRIARNLNRLLGREGQLFADRFHARALKTPREVRNALAYVLCNFRKHAAELRSRLARGARRSLSEALVGFMDACSSARWFDGWAREDAVERSLGLSRAGPIEECPVVPALTWLLRIGYRRHGLIDADATPGRH
jgi:REP element-mobilizing transposase RayT